MRFLEEIHADVHVLASEPDASLGAGKRKHFPGFVHRTPGMCFYTWRYSVEDNGFK